jgi:nucleoside-diphosphate-sugar epimerase
MKLVVLGAAGGLGRTVVEVAAADHEVIAFVRDPARVPANVTAVAGDATRADEVARAIGDADAALFCVNPPFATWLTTFPPLLEAAIAAARTTGTRLVFPANVWIYGRGTGELVGETRPASPTSKRGTLRARMEQQLRDAGIRHALLRLPEFYGPHVTTLTARVFRAALAGARSAWPGTLDAAIELVYMPDAARAMVALATAPDCDAEVFHLPGARTTPRELATAIYTLAGAKPRVTGVPAFVLRAAGVFDATIRGAADIGHLWTDPILLDGAKYRARFGEPPVTPLATGLAATLAWHRAHPELRLQG